MEFDSFKADVFQMKSQNLRLINENKSLKQKLKKLEESLELKHSLMESLIDPKKSIQSRNQNDSYILTLRDENERLKEALRAKTFLIRKLNHDLDYTKSFLPKPAKFNKFAPSGMQTEGKAKHELGNEMKRPISEGCRRRKGWSNAAHIDNKGIVDEVKNLKNTMFNIPTSDSKKPEEKITVTEPAKPVEKSKPPPKNTNKPKPKANKKLVVKKIFKANKNMKNGESSSSSVCIQMKNNNTFNLNNRENVNNLKERLDEIITKLQ